MIKINFGGRTRTFESVEAMLAKFDVSLDSLTEEERKYITRRAARGETTYVGYNPYTAEINGKKTLIISDSAESVVNRQNISSEEI